ncbi:hypothetical protein LTR10_021799 [Elasticomyces elasticus]|uniref:Uncharacterized protein n=1 Tax=Exophiala sideris TaxID=1016849 RepID=A0ABR0J6D4_9EURO|nr:hypothetical protein LTR10_021799 [Elasticomyces elasticus]KAK5028739.1 hypothetical protein LTS07_006118 [Exophiala sideris]KAK5035607.1 hypothetical protein LTR13_005736 [Exophiala sideris]KAK5057243.1 hypothetical protein LTR69_007282 [Exophiala sideris]KAK5181784.1 hypothetical protein LTR44_005984 [Eurotiomycetes sp. CCFEE 6388]
MLNFRLFYRYIVVVAIVLLTLGAFYWKHEVSTISGDWYDHFEEFVRKPWPSSNLTNPTSPTEQQSWIFRGPDAQDKAVIVPKIHGEDVSWVSDQLQDWQHAIYFMDEENEGNLHPPKNKGHEAMAYLTFLIDHYDDLPSSMVFVHAHLDGYPRAWHTDSRGYNQVRSIRSLRLEYVQEHGYANMRCISDPGCPAEIQINRHEDERTAERAFVGAWTYMFQTNASDVPDTIAQPCCSQFAVSKAQVLKRSREDYLRYRQWLLDTELDDATSGRVFEYLWHVIFGKDPVYCPPLNECRCQQFGRC